MLLQPLLKLVLEYVVVTKVQQVTCRALISIVPIATLLSAAGIFVGVEI